MILLKENYRLQGTSIDTEHFTTWFISCNLPFLLIENSIENDCSASVAVTVALLAAQLSVRFLPAWKQSGAACLALNPEVDPLLLIGFTQKTCNSSSFASHLVLL